jgi:hypothetical protein
VSFDETDQIPGVSLMGPVDMGSDSGDGIVFGFGFSFGFVVMLLGDADGGEGCFSHIFSWATLAFSFSCFTFFLALHSRVAANWAQSFLAFSKIHQGSSFWILSCFDGTFEMQKREGELCLEREAKRVNDDDLVGLVMNRIEWTITSKRKTGRKWNNG